MPCEKRFLVTLGESTRPLPALPEHITQLSLHDVSLQCSVFIMHNFKDYFFCLQICVFVFCLQICIFVFFKLYFWNCYLLMILCTWEKLSKDHELKCQMNKWFRNTCGELQKKASIYAFNFLNMSMGCVVDIMGS